MEKPITIVIVDDNPDDRALTIRELRRDFKKINIIEVFEPEKFDEVLESGDFDVVITDFQIRWTNGLKVLKKVKERYPDTPVIMYTGTGSEEVAVQAMKCGLDDYVLKSPKHFVRLPASVRTALRNIENRKAREKAEKLYKRLFENVPLGLYSVKPNGEIQAANKALVDLLEFPDKKTLYGVKTSDIYAESEKRKKWIKKLEKKGTIKDVELKLKTYKNNTIWALDKARSVKDKEGNMVLIEGSLVDITKRKKAEQAIKKNQKKLKGLHEIATKMEKCHTERELFEYSIEAAREILDFNYCTLILEEDDKLVVKATTHDLLPEGSILSKDDAIYGKTFRNKKSYIIDDVYETEEAKPTGADFNSALSVMIGHIGVLQVISREKSHFDKHDLELAEILAAHISESLNRIKYHEDLRRSEERYENIMENTHEIICLIDEKGKVRYINDAFERLIGYNKEDIIGETIFDYFYDEDKMVLMKKWMDAAESDDIYFNGTGRVVCKDGGLIWFEGKARLFRNKKGEVNKVLLVARDVTDKIKAEEELKKSEERYRSIFENTGTAIVIFEKDKTVSMMNREAERLVGYSKEEVEGKLKWTDFVVDHDREMMEKYHELRRKDPEAPPKNYTFEMVNRFGNIRQIYINIDIMPD
ncbi:MAG: PAS domain S-box protein, partial [Thermoplasmata archaeon]